MNRYIKYMMLLCISILMQTDYVSAQNIVTIPVSGVCGMCKDRIESAAKTVTGISKAEYSINTQTLTVKTKATFNKQNLVNALLAVGHDAYGQKANDEVYEKLDACCHYRDEDQEGLDHDGQERENIAVPISESHEMTQNNPNILTGTVYEKTDDGELLPIIGASITWLNEKTGTITDLDGKFKTTYKKKRNQLVVSYVGYSPDTILIEKAGNISITVSTPNLLGEVTITHKQKSTQISYLDPIKVLQISSKELIKAACCSLAESFETTPNIDAGSTDAVTGIRKIEMLGLAGPYIQLTTENMPSVRGLASLQGLSFIPGSWVESIQLNMGAGSVTNGFESLTGQINVELRKPTNDDQLYLNAYGDQSGRFEMNTFTRHIVDDHWSTASLLHISSRNFKSDRNSDEIGRAHV